MSYCLNETQYATMKFLKFSWNEERGASPDLPSELWRKIIAFTVRLTGAKSIKLDDPFSTPYMNEEYPEVDPGLFRDRKSLTMVCSSWHAIVTEISAEYLVIYSREQLKALVMEFESNKKSIGKCLGERTSRIDFKILGQYNVTHVVRLLRCTPNLLIYLNKNGPPSSPQKPTPMKVIRCLIAYCSRSLRRVEWSGAGEAPRYQDLVELCNRLPDLVTLRLVAIFSFPNLQEAIPPLILPNLKTLSLAEIPVPAERRPNYALTWDLFLRYASISSEQLPVLEHFECDIFPQTMQFFDIHGDKLFMFRTTPSSTSSALPDALSLCPNLHILIISQGSEEVALPIFHPKITKICIIPKVEVMVGFPQRLLDYAVMTPLDTLLRSLERMVTPRLIELRIRNVGSYVDIIHYSTWLHFWWIRWNIQGVQFCDKDGGSYRYIRDPREGLLDSIRG